MSELSLCTTLLVAYFLQFRFIEVWFEGRHALAMCELKARWLIARGLDYTEPLKYWRSVKLWKMFWQFWKPVSSFYDIKRFEPPDLDDPKSVTISHQPHQWN